MRTRWWSCCRSLHSKGGRKDSVLGCKSRWLWKVEVRWQGNLPLLPPLPLWWPAKRTWLVLKERKNCALGRELRNDAVLR